MLKAIPCLIILLLAVGCAQKAGPVKARAEKDPKRAAVEEKIAKTTQEGKDMIEKVKGMKPIVNDQQATKTLGEIVNTYANDKGAYNISPIGWEASQKKPFAGEQIGRWKVMFHYQDWQKQYLAAEWEYNPTTGKMYPFEFENAKEFWTGEGGEKAAETGKAKK